MPASTKLDLLQGASRTKNLQDKRGDNAVRPFRVKDLTAANTNADEAITAVIAAAGAVHQSDTTLEPLAVTVSRKPGFTRVRGHISYGRGPTSIPTQEAWKLATKTGGTYNLRYYKDPATRDATGRPNGIPQSMSTDVTSLGTQFRARAFSFPVGMQTIRLRTVLDSDPSDSLTPYLDMVNDTALTLAAACTPAGTGDSTALEFGPFELWFKTFSADAIDTSGGIKWVVNYLLLYTAAPGWVQQDIVGFPYSYDPARLYNATTYSSGAAMSLPFGAILDTVFPTKLGDLTGVFPVHTPL